MLFFNNKVRQDNKGPRILIGSERQHVFNVNFQLFAITLRACEALQIGVERRRTIVATTTRCIYVATTNNNSGLKDFSGSLMC